MIGGGLLALAACVAPEAPPDRPAPSPPIPPLTFDAGVPSNLLMISIDTLRVDQLSRWRSRWPGADPPPMPPLAGIVASSVVLDDHVGCSNWTYHAATCTVAGADPLDWGFVPRFDLDGLVQILPPRAYLADWLGEAGFHTSLISTNTLFSASSGNGTGYDTHRLLVQPGLTPAE